MIGYHFTSLENYKLIRREGLKTYELTNDGDPFEFASRRMYYGIFVFTEPPIDAADEIGCVIRQLAFKKGALQVVLLQVHYSSKDLRSINGWSVDMKHSGKIQNWQYHKNKPSVILFYNIPPERVELVRTYDLRDILRNGSTYDDYQSDIQATAIRTRR